MKKRTTSLLTTIVAMGLCLMFLAPPAFAGKKDNTLNIAFSKELETLDRYFNTAREGIVFARLV
jgi:peptide/nickel transport system substrate-binding protein